ncbi:MAG: trypsin-like peptidase domain-containing protein [Polyangiales bacterium]
MTPRAHASFVLLAIGLALSSCRPRGRVEATSSAADASAATPSPPAPPPAPPAIPAPPAADAATASADAALPAPGTGPLPNSPSSFAPVVRSVRGSVVSVFAAVADMDGMTWGWNTPHEERLRLGKGTGFIITESGEILTNNHVIEGARFIQVQFDDGRRYGAAVVGRDPRLDVALLRVKAPGLRFQPARLGNSDRMEVGDWVIAIGNPYGLSQTVTAGIVSAVNRTANEVSAQDDSFGNLLQTDASINPGNSGGPLLNLRGEVIGINVAVHGRAQGVGFAIPINMATVVLPQLRQFGRAVRSWLGVQWRRVDESTRLALGLDDSHGALIMSVNPTSPASQGGLRPGDVIRSFDEHPLLDGTQLPWLVSSAGVGHRARVGVLRADDTGAYRPVTVDVTLAAVPEAVAVPRPQLQGVPGMVPIP